MMGIVVGDAAEAEHARLHGERPYTVSVIGKQAKYARYVISDKRLAWMGDHPDDLTFFYSVADDGTVTAEGRLDNAAIIGLLEPLTHNVVAVRLPKEGNR